MYISYKLLGTLHTSVYMSNILQLLQDHAALRRQPCASFLVEGLHRVKPLLLAVQVVKRAVNAENVSSYLHFAARYHLSALTEYCQAFCLDNLCKVVPEKSFLSLPVSTLRLILQSDSLAIESEYAIFEVGFPFNEIFGLRLSELCTYTYVEGLLHHCFQGMRR